MKKFTCEVQQNKRKKGGTKKNTQKNYDSVREYQLDDGSNIYFPILHS